MAELEVGHLQLASLTTDDHPALRPVELEGFAGGKDQHYQRPFGADNVACDNVACCWRDRQSRAKAASRECLLLVDL